MGSEPLRKEDRAEHVFVRNSLERKKRQRGEESSLVKGPSTIQHPSSELLEGEDGGWRRDGHDKKTRRGELEED